MQLHLINNTFLQLLTVKYTKAIDNFYALLQLPTFVYRVSKKKRPLAEISTNQFLVLKTLVLFIRTQKEIFWIYRNSIFIEYKTRKEDSVGLSYPLTDFNWSKSNSKTILNCGLQAKQKADVSLTSAWCEVDISPTQEKPLMHQKTCMR